MTRRFFIAAARAVAFGFTVASLPVGCGAPSAKQSGFLEDYSRLNRPEDGGPASFTDSSADLGAFDRVLVEPIQIIFTDDAQAQRADAAEVRALADEFRAELERLLGGERQLVESRAPGVLVVRGALTDARRTTAILNVHPATKLSGAGLGWAAAEIEAIDGGTGRRVYAYMDRREGNRLRIAEGLAEWGHAREVLKEFAAEVARGLAPPLPSAAGAHAEGERP